MENECTIVCELLLQHTEGGTSGETLRGVETHPEKCSACRAAAEKMKSAHGTEPTEKPAGDISVGTRDADAKNISENCAAENNAAEKSVEGGMRK